MVAHVFISGFVQGVGFRQFVKRSAIKLGLTGWVKNLSDNRVEAVFAGTKEQIEKTIEFYKDSFNQIDKGGKIVVVGTRWAAQDLYGHILNTACTSVNGKKIEKGQGSEWFKHVSF